MNKRASAHKKISELLLTLLLLMAGTAAAQEFGGNPPSIKWKQVNTPSAKVIFPYGMDAAGINVANIVQQMNGLVKPTIGNKQLQISIVLQNQTTISNAYVGLAPFRSEFFLTPEQNSFDIGSLPWQQQLAIHEYRHVQQYNNFNVGLSHFLRILFGEGGQALGNDLSVPNWFFEGDAVYNETLVSRQGRGRLPYFFNGYHALWAARKDYSYMKLRNGSYRDYVPDHYPLGYMLVSYGREKYGDEVWKKITHDAAGFYTGFYPFQRAVKKYTGVNFKQFTNDAFVHFQNEFGYIPSDGPKTLVNEPVKLDHQHFDADREYPAFVNDSTLIYMKSSYDHIPSFVVKSGSGERKISTRSYSLDNYFDYHNGKIVYASYHPDARWGYRDYSELMLLDVNTGQEHRITKKAKYFAPAFSADGESIVAVRVDPSGKSKLHILDTEGKLVNSVPNPQKLFYTYPKFYKDKIVAAVRDGAGKMSLAMINKQSGEAKYLLPFTYQPIVFPAIKNDTIYFSATSGKDELLYKLSLADSKLYFTTSFYNNGTIGYYQPAIAEGKFAWVGFTAEGYKINVADKEKLAWRERKALIGNLPDFEIDLNKDSSAHMLARVVDKPLTVTNYSKAHGLFNFHSIIPNISDPNYSFAITGQNVLNTFQSEISFNYNSNEGYKEFGFNAIYGALYPYLSAGVDYTLDRRGFAKGSYVYWNETELHGGLQVPLNFSQGKNFTGLSFGSSVYFNRTSFQQPYASQFADRSYTYLNNSLSFSNQTQRAKKNIYPMFAQSISLNYKTAISGISANQFLASGTFYFPGLFTNHSFAVNVAHQQKGKDNVISFSNDFPFSIGYTVQSLDDMNKVGLAYHFPIAYPDAGFGNLVYLLRLRGSLFFDYTHASASNYYTDGSSFKQNFRSTGAAIFFDTKFFNQNSISFGIRYSRLLDNDSFGFTGRNRVELVLPVSFF